MKKAWDVINKYLMKYKLKKTDFARKCDISRVWLYGIKKGRIGINIAKRIERGTNGEIKAEWLIFPEKYQKEIEEYLNGN